MGLLVMNLFDWLQELAITLGVIVLFILILYYRYPKLRSGLNKLSGLRKGKDKKKDKYTDIEKIDLIVGIIARTDDDKESISKALKRIKEIVD
jgi:hypothetical protein